MSAPQSDLNFGQALALLKAGFKVARESWMEVGMWVALSEDRAFFMFLSQEHPVLWANTHNDLLATDWRVIL